MTKLSSQHLRIFKELRNEWKPGPYSSYADPTDYADAFNRYSTAFTSWLASNLESNNRTEQLNAILEIIHAEKTSSWLAEKLIDAFTIPLFAIIEAENSKAEKKQYILANLTDNMKKQLINRLFAIRTASQLQQALPHYRLLFEGLPQKDLLYTLGRMYRDYNWQFNSSIINLLSETIDSDIFMTFLMKARVNNKAIIEHLFDQLNDLTGISGKTLYTLVQTKKFLLTTEKSQGKTAILINTVPHEVLCDFFYQGLQDNNNGVITYFNSCTTKKAAKIILKAIEQDKLKLVKALYDNYDKKSALLSYFFTHGAHSKFIAACDNEEGIIKAFQNIFLLCIDNYKTNPDRQLRHDFVNALSVLAINDIDLAVDFYRLIPEPGTNETKAKYLFFTDPSRIDTRTPLFPLNQLHLVSKLDQGELAMLAKHKPGYLNYLTKLYQETVEDIINENGSLIIKKSEAQQETLLNPPQAQQAISMLINNDGLIEALKILAHKLVAEVPEEARKNRKAFVKWLHETDEPISYTLEEALLNNLLLHSKTAFNSLAEKIWADSFKLSSNRPCIAAACKALLKYNRGIQAGLLNITRGDIAHEIIQKLYFDGKRNHAVNLFIGLDEHQQNEIFKYAVSQSVGNAFGLLQLINNHATTNTRAQDIVIRLFLVSNLEFNQIPSVTIRRLLFSSDLAFPVMKRAQLIEQLSDNEVHDLLTDFPWQKIIPTYKSLSNITTQQKLASNISEDTVDSILKYYDYSAKDKQSFFEGILNIDTQASLLHRLLLSGENEPAHEKLALDLLQQSVAQGNLAFAILRLMKQQNSPSSISSKILAICFNKPQMIDNLGQFAKAYSANPSDESYLAAYQTIVTGFFGINKPKHFIMDTLYSILVNGDGLMNGVFQQTILFFILQGHPSVENQQRQTQLAQRIYAGISSIADLFNHYHSQPRLALFFSALAETRTELEFKIVIMLLKRMSTPQAFLNQIELKHLARIFNYAVSKKVMDEALTNLFAQLSASIVVDMMLEPLPSKKNAKELISLPITLTTHLFELFKDQPAKQAQILFRLHTQAQASQLTRALVNRVCTIDTDNDDTSDRLQNILTSLYDLHQDELGTSQYTELAATLFISLMNKSNFDGVLKVFNGIDSKITQHLWEVFNSEGFSDQVDQSNVQGFYKHLGKPVNSDNTHIKAFLDHLQPSQQAKVLLKLLATHRLSNVNHLNDIDDVDDELMSPSKPDFSETISAIFAVANKEQFNNVINIIKYLPPASDGDYLTKRLCTVLIHSEDFTALWPGFDKDAQTRFIESLLKRSFTDLLAEFIIIFDGNRDIQIDILLTSLKISEKMPSVSSAYYAVINKTFDQETSALEPTEEAQKLTTRDITRAAEIIQALVHSEKQNRLIFNKYGQALIQQILERIVFEKLDTEQVDTGQCENGHDDSRDHEGWVERIFVWMIAEVLGCKIADKVAYILEPASEASRLFKKAFEQVAQKQQEQASERDDFAPTAQITIEQARKLDLFGPKDEPLAAEIEEESKSQFQWQNVTHSTAVANTLRFRAIGNSSSSPRDQSMTEQPYSSDSESDDEQDESASLIRPKQKTA